MGTNENTLFGVVSISPNDAWAVGQEASGTDYHTLIEHWNGSAWSVVPSPDPPSSEAFNPELVGVAALASNDVWAVGYSQGGQATKLEELTLIEHWDGAQWSVVDSPNPGAIGDTLLAIGGNASTGLWAVGDQSSSTISATTTTALTLQLNNGAWTPIVGANPSPTDNELWGVSAISSSNVWAVGLQGNGPNSETLAEHWDGANWTAVSSVDPLPTNAWFNGVAVAANGVPWSVGEEYVSNAQARNGFAETGNTNGLHLGNYVSIAKYNRLISVAAVPGGRVWAVGMIEDSPGYTETLIELLA